MERYWPERRLNTSTADIWVAIDQETQERVVMKRTEIDQVSDFSDKNERTQREAKVLKELSSPLSGMPKRVVGYRATCTLADVLKERKYLTEPEAKIMMRALLEGLVFIHKKYLVHRDLKPENLFLYDPNNLDTLKLGDFGVCCEENGYSNIGGIRGTRGYMAPEVLSGSRYGRPADMWSAGTLLYQSLLGVLPFPVGKSGGERALAKGMKRVVFSGFNVPSISDEAKSFIESLMAYDPDKRLTAAKALEHPWMANIPP
ncbi:Serine/threonine-protein kinase 33, partial [Blyttiomyces sp. JEL0837]